MMRLRPKRVDFQGRSLTVNEARQGRNGQMKAVIIADGNQPLPEVSKDSSRDTSSGRT